MRLYDRIKHDSINFPDMPVIDGSQIAAQIDAMPDEMLPFEAEDFECVSPPFDQFFVESTTGSGPGIHQRGLHIEVARPEIAKAYREHAHDRATTVLAMWAVMYWEARLWVSEGFAVVGLDSSGHFVDDMSEISIMTPPDTPALMSWRYMPAQSVPGYIPFAFMTIRAMHRKAPIERVTHTRQQRRRAERKGQPMPRDYYVINVDPRVPRRVSDVGAPPAGAASRRSPDFVREHYKFYTKERPLFGKYSGIVKIPERKKSGADRGEELQKRLYRVKDDV